MFRQSSKPVFVIIILTALVLTLAIPVGRAEGFVNVKAPLAPGHNIIFSVTGVPDGVAFTISGVRVNNGGNPASYTTTFTTPDLSAAIVADPGSTFTYNDFPVSVTVGTQQYQLVSSLPASPFVVGTSGGATTVIATYAASCISPSILADPVDQTVVYGDPTAFSISAAGSPPLTYEWYKDGGQIPGEDQSTFSILSANISDAGRYHAVVNNACGSASSAQVQLTVNKANQTITFNQPVSPAVFGTTFVVSPIASSGLPVDLAALGSCTAVNNEVSMTIGVGVCTLIASQPGDGNYNPAGDVVRTVGAARADQVIEFPAPLSPAVYGTVFTMSLSASSGLPVSLFAAGGCSNFGAQVTMTSGSTGCTLTASQAGDDNYEPAANVAHTVEAARASQVISFEQPASPVKYQTSFTVVPLSSSNLPVALAASGSCTNNGYTVTMTRTSGTCVLTASQPGDLNFLPSEDVQRTVDPAPNGNIMFIPLLFGS